jgi:hypothetical protein
MNTKAKLFTGAIALTLATSAIFSATSASAGSYDDDRYDRKYGISSAQRDRYERLEDRYERLKDRYERLNNRDHRYNSRRNVYINRSYQPYGSYYNGNYYNRSIVRLPSGCRRVVYRDRTYYTRNNYDYYTYDSNRRGYVVVNLPGIRIGF